MKVLINSFSAEEIDAEDSNADFEADLEKYNLFEVQSQLMQLEVAYCTLVTPKPHSPSSPSSSSSSSSSLMQPQQLPSLGRGLYRYSLPNPAKVTATLSLMSKYLAKTCPKPLLDQHYAHPSSSSAFHSTSYPTTPSSSLLLTSRRLSQRLLSRHSPVFQSDHDAEEQHDQKNIHNDNQQLTVKGDGAEEEIRWLWGGSDEQEESLLTQIQMYSGAYLTPPRNNHGNRTKSTKALSLWSKKPASSSFNVNSYNPNSNSYQSQYCQYEPARSSKLLASLSMTRHFRQNHIVSSTHDRVQRLLSRPSSDQWSFLRAMLVDLADNHIDSNQDNHASSDAGDVYASVKQANTVQDLESGGCFEIPPFEVTYCLYYCILQHMSLAPLHAEEVWIPLLQRWMRMFDPSSLWEVKRLRLGLNLCAIDACPAPGGFPVIFVHDLHRTTVDIQPYLRLVMDLATLLYCWLLRRSNLVVFDASRSPFDGLIPTSRPASKSNSNYLDSQKKQHEQQQSKAPVTINKYAFLVLPFVLNHNCEKNNYTSVSDANNRSAGNNHNSRDHDSGSSAPARHSSSELDLKETLAYLQRNMGVMNWTIVTLSAIHLELSDVLQLSFNSVKEFLQLSKDVLHPLPLSPAHPPPGEREKERYKDDGSMDVQHEDNTRMSNKQDSNSINNKNKQKQNPSSNAKEYNHSNNHNNNGHSSMNNSNVSSSSSAASLLQDASSKLVSSWQTLQSWQRIHSIVRALIYHVSGTVQWINIFQNHLMHGCQVDGGLSMALSLLLLQEMFQQHKQQHNQPQHHQQHHQQHQQSSCALAIELCTGYLQAYTTPFTVRILLFNHDMCVQDLETEREKQRLKLVHQPNTHDDTHETYGRHSHGDSVNTNSGSVTTVHWSSLRKYYDFLTRHVRALEASGTVSASVHDECGVSVQSGFNNRCAGGPGSLGAWILNTHQHTQHNSSTSTRSTTSIDDDRMEGRTRLFGTSSLSLLNELLEVALYLAKYEDKSGSLHKSSGHAGGVVVGSTSSPVRSPVQGNARRGGPEGGGPRATSSRSRSIFLVAVRSLLTKELAHHQQALLPRPLVDTETFSNDPATKPSADATMENDHTNHVRDRHASLDLPAAMAVCLHFGFAEGCLLAAEAFFLQLQRQWPQRPNPQGRDRLDRLFNNSHDEHSTLRALRRDWSRDEDTDKDQETNQAWVELQEMLWMLLSRCAEQILIDHLLVKDGDLSSRQRRVARDIDVPALQRQVIRYVEIAYKYLSFFHSAHWNPTTITTNPSSPASASAARATFNGHAALCRVILRPFDCLVKYAAWPTRRTSLNTSLNTSLITSEVCAEEVSLRRGAVLASGASLRALQSAAATLDDEDQAMILEDRNASVSDRGAESKENEDEEETDDEEVSYPTIGPVKHLPEYLTEWLWSFLVQQHGYTAACNMLQTVDMSSFAASLAFDSASSTAVVASDRLPILSHLSRHLSVEMILYVQHGLGHQPHSVENSVL